MILKKIFSCAVIYSGYYGLVRYLNKPKVSVLMYHRVLDKEDGFDHMIISASRKTFEEQMKYLKKRHNIISFNDLKDGVKKNSVIITFDDGYVDNYYNAYPILKKYKIPATMYLPTGYINTKKIFWWDKLAYMVKKTRLKRVHFQGLRISLLDKRLAIKKLQSLIKPHRNKSILLKKLSETLLVQVPKNDTLFLNWEQIREMSNNGISFGAHTVNHPVLSGLSMQESTKEIIDSKVTIEKKIGKKALTFAYPYGMSNDLNIALDSYLKEKDFDFSVTAEYGTNNHNKFRLKRIGINSDDDLNTFKIKIEGIGKKFGYLYLKHLKK